MKQDTPQDTPKEKTLEQKLQEEATEYYNMAKEYRRDRYMKEETEAYVMSKQWLKKWKEYVNYGFIKRNIQYSYYYSQYSNKKYEIKAESKPTEIDNKKLLVPLDSFLNDGDINNPENVVIRHDINQKLEVKIVNKAIWDFFQRRYGGGPEIKKGTIEEQTRYSTIPKKIIEIFYRKFSFLSLPKRSDFTSENINNTEIRTIYISRSKKLSDLKGKYSSLMHDKAIYSKEGVSEKNLRLWKLSSNTSTEQFKKVFSERADQIKSSESLFKCGDLSYLEYVENASLDEVELADTDICIVEYSTPASPWIFEVKKIEQKEGKCDWCNSRRLLRYFCPCKEVWYCREDCMDKDKMCHQSRCKKRFEVEENAVKESDRSRKGLVGLQNLGNTCFMSTSLQCISNCYELTQYFLKDHYKKDINVDNPIGSSGVLAKSYANFLKNVWYGESGVFSPWNFKRAISTFQSMFSGYQQHDTQEFLNYLLDGLHEDLNRVLRKPLVEKDESKKEDVLKSKEQWIDFLRRNQSVLVDLLYGQYKSTLYCPDQDCQNVSNTFDPFLSVSLPLVAKTETYEVTCFFIFYSLKIKPLQLNLPFSMETTIMALRNKVARILQVHPFSFFVIKMDANGNYDHLLNSSALLKTNNYYHSANQKPFFLFQIDPELFYSNYNKFCLHNESALNLKRDFSAITEEMEKREEDNKKLFSDDYEEEEHGTTGDSVCYYSKIYYNTLRGKQAGIMKINVDENYGFSDDFIKVLIFLKKWDDSNKRNRIIFPRILYLNKSWSTKQVHLYIFKYFAELVRAHHNLKENEWTDEKLFTKFFNGLDFDNENDCYEYQEKNNWPYRLRMKNFNATRYGTTCHFCGNSNCSDCLLPFDESITLGEVINRIPKNEDGQEIDNTYLFLNEKQKFYSSNNNKDFQLEATWLPEYHPAVHNLNDKRDYDFRIIRSAKAKTVSIYDCFKNFVKLEKLEENNEWYCPECKKHQKATKKMEIYKSPHILIIHLKRFRNNSKIDTVVDFPINGLDISHYVMSNEKGVPQVYDLFAIANHMGSMGFGHYISYAKNPLDQKWYEFDDSHVSRKNENELISSTAYVLFYRRRGLENFIDTNQIYNKKFVNYEERTANGDGDTNMDGTTPGNGTSVNGTPMNGTTHSSSNGISNNNQMDVEENSHTIDASVPSQSL